MSEQLEAWKQDLEDIVFFAMNIAEEVAPGQLEQFMREAAIECRAKAEEVRNRTDVGGNRRGG